MSETTIKQTEESINLQEVDQIIAHIGSSAENLIPLLQAIQEHFNYLPQEALDRLAETTSIRPADITGVSSFYAQFRMKPAGKHTVKVCIGTACHVMGAEALYHAFKDYLHIPADDDTDDEMLFTVEKVACLGCCMLAPAVQIDDITYGFVKTTTIGQVLTDFLAAQNAGSGKEQSARSDSPLRGEVRMCLCSSCIASGAMPVYEAIQNEIARSGLPVKLNNVGCTGMAYQTPLLEVVMDDGRHFNYGRVKAEDVPTILARHFEPSGITAKGRLSINSLLERIYTDEAWEPVTRYSVDTRSGPDACYTSPQKRIVTECAGEVDPLDLNAYKKLGGFEGLKRVLTMTPEQMQKQVDESGLRGRGGGGFPTGLKWKAVMDATDKKRYLICNADEGDPGAFMDRMILESFPYRTIEGMIIAAKAVGAAEGIIYVRAEYPLALVRIKEAIQHCEANNLTGKNILGSDFHFTLNVTAGAGAFVCGEETALIAAVEGRRGMPRQRPPYPSESGLHGKPTLVNNVETYSLLPFIFRQGAAQFNSFGTKTSKGTKAFALAGKIRRSGLIEVPMGLTLRQIVEEIGGGIPNDKKLKAIQVGGPSGGCIPARLADTPVDYEALTGVGAMMGSGGLVVLDEDDCMVDIAKYFMSFTQDESCGKCTYCRIGTKRMLEILQRLTEGRAKSDDLERMEELAYSVKSGSLCGLGKTAPNPVLSTMEHFREEYEAHIQGRCPAGKCKALITYSINDNCIGCTICSQRCAAGAIEMRPYEVHEIDTEKCVQCDTCRTVCPVEAVEIN
ncbi:NAD(P)H-dependent oxidoreductase subunit E [bacterium]|nr:NAD(P)H-dependent oxidoreductase subunit E [bacterium]